MRRFRRIYREFGSGELVRTLVLLVGLVAMALFGFLAFSSPATAVIAAAGMGLGWLLRHWIAQGVEHYSNVIPVGLTVYGVVLFLGDRLGLDRNGKLLVITVTTVIVFNLKFWSLSDQGVVNAAANEAKQSAIEASLAAPADERSPRGRENGDTAPV